MEASTIEKLEEGVGRLLDAFARLKAENSALREKIVELESDKDTFRDRLDSLIARLENSFPE